MRPLRLVLVGVVLLLGAAAVLSQSNPLSPAQIHLSFGSDPSSSMTATFVTMNLSSTTLPTAVWGLSASALTQRATGKSLEYFATTAYRYASSVTMTGLAGDTTYYYQVGFPDGGYSPVSSFTTGPSTLRPFTFALYGDMGVLNGDATRSSMIKMMPKYEWIFHLGDIAYSDDLPTKDYSNNFDNFFNAIEPYSSQKAYQVLPGNHDADCHTTGAAGCNAKLNNFTFFRERWTMPNTPAQNMWYNFNYSYAQFISISSETDFPHAPEGRDTIYRCGPFGNQMAWLEAQLQQAQQYRAERPWLIVTGHRPLYSCPVGDFPPDAMQRLRSTMEPLFLKYGVDVYLSGHIHGYERMWPIANGVIYNQTDASSFVNPPAPTYVVLGNAGNIEGHAKDLQQNAPGSPLVANYNAVDYGYSMLTIDQTTFSWTSYRNTDHSVIDSFTITKSN